MTIVGFTNGITGSSKNYPPQGRAYETPFSVSPDDLIIPEDKKSQQERIYGEINHLYTKGPVQFSIINDNDEARRNVMLNLGWGSSIKQRSTQVALERIGEMNPGLRLIVPAAAGLYGVARMSKDVRQEWGRTGSFARAGAIFREGIDDALDEERPLDAAGYSQGARIALGMVAASEMVQTVTLIDPPGSRKKKLRRVIFDSAFKEGRYGKEYAALGERDADLQEIGPESMLGSSLETASLRALFRSFGESLGSATDLLLRQPRALGKEALYADIMTALPKIHDKLTIISPHDSAINNFDDMAQVMERVAATQRQVVLQHVDLPNTTHSYAQHYLNANALFFGGLQ